LKGKLSGTIHSYVGMTEHARVSGLAVDKDDMAGPPGLDALLSLKVGSKFAEVHNSMDSNLLEDLNLLDYRRGWCARLYAMKY